MARPAPTRKRQRNKVVVSFDMDARKCVLGWRQGAGPPSQSSPPPSHAHTLAAPSDYITGFRKRRAERRVKALEDIAKRERNDKAERRRMVCPAAARAPFRPGHRSAAGSRDLIHLISARAAACHPVVLPLTSPPHSPPPQRREAIQETLEEAKRKREEVGLLGGPEDEAASRPETSEMALDSEFARKAFGDGAVVVSTTLGTEEEGDEEERLAQEVKRMKAAHSEAKGEAYTEAKLRVPTLHEVKEKKKQRYRQKKPKRAPSKRDKKRGSRKK